MNYYELSEQVLGSKPKPSVSNVTSTEDFKEEFDIRFREIATYYRTFTDAQQALELLNRVNSTTGTNSRVRAITLECISDTLGTNVENISIEGIIDGITSISKGIWGKVISAWNWFWEATFLPTTLSAYPVGKTSNNHWGESYTLRGESDEVLKGIGWGDYKGLTDFMKNGEKYIKDAPWATEEEIRRMMLSFSRCQNDVTLPGHQDLEGLALVRGLELVDSYMNGSGRSIDTLKHRVTFNKGTIDIIKVVGPVRVNKPFLSILVEFPKHSRFLLACDEYVTVFKKYKEKYKKDKVQMAHFARFISVIMEEIKDDVLTLAEVTENYNELQLVLWSLYYGKYIKRAKAPMQNRMLHFKEL